MESNQYDVLIIGGGITGLSAARTLSNESYTLKFAILEATHKPGGRICEASLNGQSPLEKKFDVGASWIHGIVDNPLYDFYMETLKKLNKDQHDPIYGWSVTEEGLEEQDCNSTLIDNNGYIVDLSLVQFAYTLFRNALDEVNSKALSLDRNGLESYHELTPSQLINLSVGDVLNNEISNNPIPNHFTDFEKQWIMKCVEFFIDDTGQYCASELENCSFVLWMMDNDFSGDQLLLKNMFQSIIMPLAEGLPPQTILYNKKVTHIDWSEEESPDNTYPIIITVNDNEIYRAKKVIVTLPMGVLKKDHYTLFHPHLPHTHTHFLDYIGFGYFNKIILKFDTPFWQSKCPTNYFGLLGDGDLSHTIYTLKNEPYKVYELFTHLSMSVLNLYNCLGEPTLIIFVYGTSCYALEGLEDDDLISLLCQRLSTIFNTHLTHTHFTHTPITNTPLTHTQFDVSIPNTHTDMVHTQLNVHTPNKYNDIYDKEYLGNSTGYTSSNNTHTDSTVTHHDYIEYPTHHNSQGIYSDVTHTEDSPQRDNSIHTHEGDFTHTPQLNTHLNHPYPIDTHTPSTHTPSTHTPSTHTPSTHTPNTPLSNTHKNMENKYQNTAHLTGYKFHKWGLDTHTLGGFSYTHKGLVSSDFDEFNKPISNKIYFAGEGLSKLHIATTSGAFILGQTVAQTILQQFD